MYRRKESRIDIKLEILIWFKEWAKAAADEIIALIDNIHAYCAKMQRANQNMIG